MYNSLLPAILFLCSCLLILSCGSKNEQLLEDFYFPTELSGNGIVYAYEIQPGNTREYWFLKKHPRTDQPRHSITVYDETGEQQQLSIEKKVANGWQQEKLYLFFPDQDRSSRVEASIQQPDLFYFSPKDSLDVILYHIEWEEELEGEMTSKRLIRNRRWFGLDTFQLFGTQTPMTYFYVRTVHEDTREGTLSLEMQTLEFYAKNWGLIRKEQYLNGNFFRSYDLVDTLSMAQFANLQFETNKPK